MDCIACGNESARVRAVVDTVDERVLGPACRSCVDGFFGRVLDLYADAGRDCLCCERDGFYALPEWRCETVETNQGVLVTDQNVEVAPTTPRLCREHFVAFRGTDDALPADHAASTPRSPGD